MFGKNVFRDMPKEDLQRLLDKNPDIVQIAVDEILRLRRNDQRMIRGMHWGRST